MKTKINRSTYIQFIHQAQEEWPQTIEITCTNTLMERVGKMHTKIVRRAFEFERTIQRMDGTGGISTSMYIVIIYVKTIYTSNALNSEYVGSLLTSSFGRYVIHRQSKS